MASVINKVMNVLVYRDIDGTWNPMLGICLALCSYCYMMFGGRSKPKGMPRLDERAFKVDLGGGKKIWVGSSNDLGCLCIEDLKRVIAYLARFPDSEFLISTKFPDVFLAALKAGMLTPRNVIISMSLETNRWMPEIYKGKQKPLPPKQRTAAFNKLVKLSGWRCGITVDPVMKFDLYPFIEMLKSAKPAWVYFGTDSKGHRLPEPTLEEMDVFFKEVRKFTTLHLFGYFDEKYTLWKRRTVR